MNKDEIKTVQEHLRLEYQFQAGILNAQVKKQVESETATVWLSDSTLIKQFNSRDGQSFNAEIYSYLPSIINTPDNLFKLNENKQRKLYFLKKINGNWYFLVMKYLKDNNEIFIDSFRRTNTKEIKTFNKKYEKLE